MKSEGEIQIKRKGKDVCGELLVTLEGAQYAISDVAKTEKGIQFLIKGDNEIADLILALMEHQLFHTTK